MTVTQPITMQLRVTLDPGTLSVYEREAEEYGVEIERLLESRLKECKEYNATTPLYFNDDQRRELEKIFSRNMRSSADVMAMVRRLLEVKVNGLTVTLPPQVLERLRTRCPRGTDFGPFLQQQMMNWAEQYVGMR